MTPAHPLLRSPLPGPGGGTVRPSLARPTPDTAVWSTRGSRSAVSGPCVARPAAPTCSRRIAPMGGYTRELPSNFG